ncbi:ubiquitin-related domain-containing protein [Pseudoneurospora amorphoporcata]|uniref:Ubiquitin-like modifier HUB1 n=1 Tax=Pseudoneurospora amorphoporcata TaxID=241081 RepID=A0AAN6P357_9PEZI|nr:ubiquitin-related domain-containing protein [Pseudoneurospora amorphoporcata]
MADSDRQRSRSRSPSRKPKINTGGFKWKSKPSTGNDDNQDRAGLQRGYRDRSPRRNNRDRDDDRNRDRDRDRDSGRDRDRSPRRRDDRGDRDRDQRGGGGGGDRYRGDSYRGGDRDRDRDHRDRRDRSRSPRRRDDRDRSPRRNNRSPRRDRLKKEKKDDKDKPRAPAAPSGGGEEMIIVTVNDRLGTKAQIPAFPSDTIKQFKVMVAMRVGREPHEILLKRQGERPFKDQLSLADYGVSSGVQIDLEVDTGD